MSAWDSVLTRLEVHWRTAIPTLGAGTLGVERGPKPVAELTSGQVPHVFFYDLAYRAAPVQADDDGPAAGNQMVEAFRLRCDMWTRNETQDAIRLKAEAFRAAVDADRTLGGVVEFAYVSDEDIVEADFLDKPERLARVVLAATRVV